jgi:hypothetical protein
MWRELDHRLEKRTYNSQKIQFSPIRYLHPFIALRRTLVSLSPIPIPIPPSTDDDRMIVPRAPIPIPIRPRPRTIVLDLCP